MSALASVRRKRTAVMLTVNLLAVVALGGFGLAGVRALKRYEGATKVSVESKTLPITPVGMLATVDSDDVLTSIAIFVLKAGDQLGGSIVSVPVSSDSTAGVAKTAFRSHRCTQKAAPKPWCWVWRACCPSPSTSVPLHRRPTRRGC